MNIQYKYADFINLHVEGRISKEDARRQMRTASAILDRIGSQPGIILADEVGMGKTFIALAVACSVHYADPERRPVVVMVPSSLIEKWPRDFQLFRDRCISEEYREEFTYATAHRAEEFLKFLDDPVDRRKTLIFLTHGAMSRGLTDGWIKLALIQRALYRRRNTQDLKKALRRLYGRLLDMRFIDRKDPEVWDILMRSRPERWLNILQRHGIDPENDDDLDTDDDPIPEAIIDILGGLETDEVYHALHSIPLRHSRTFDQRVSLAKKSINKELKRIWATCLTNLNLSLPLLIMDEAHHLKNSQTVLASFFKSAGAEDDSRMLSREGALAYMFERMLFLTATPFQLGHVELCNVLERFTGINWKSPVAPEGGVAQFLKELDSLKQRLDESQIYAINLDRVWSRLSPSDLVLEGVRFDTVDLWWERMKQDPKNGSYHALRVYDLFFRTRKVIKAAEKSLRKWLIRHNKDKYLPGTDRIPRRSRLPGNAIAEYDAHVDEDRDRGIKIAGSAALPFLLSARLTAITPDSRPVFAEGLASSYEAFMHTRRIRRLEHEKNITDIDDEPFIAPVLLDDSEWYLNELEQLLPGGKKPSRIEHPKIKATVERAIALWLRGEKVLVFCHYIATGKAIRNYLSEAVYRTILREGAKKMNCSQKRVVEELDKIGKRFMSEETRIRRAVDNELYAMADSFPGLKGSESLEKLIDSIRRYLRTPSFLVRYFPLGSQIPDDRAFLKALTNMDASGLTLEKIITGFMDFLENRCEAQEKESYIDALSRIQPGGIRGKELRSTYSSEEIEDSDESFIIQPNVRLVNGSTKQETRQRLMLTFNTPFYPDILIASSVMAEGVDLHLNCRHIIHHDLCWNPSTLEQRTGRVDRIGSKAEQSREPINVYIPYIAETQDEKMFRVVMDRERWFKVVMGEKFSLDAQTTEKMAERIPIPLSIAEELSFKLGV